MDKEIDVFIEQLREKDCQIERLQHIIENLTKKEDEEDEVEERPEQHVPTFWENPMSLSDWSWQEQSQLCFFRGGGELYGTV